MATTSVSSLLLLSEMIFPAVENVLSEVADVAGMQRYCLANALRRGKACRFSFEDKGLGESPKA